ncbi:MAG TPA: dTDP-glucose 4,6-dehydratase [Planctomycetaceae bacterium]|nr:dTDP-glucose 4,6-dehydratase [Planctomycetaceae bacterium]
MKTYLVTGGAGFIGGCFVRKCVAEGNVRVINFDALTYAGNLASVPEPDRDRHVFIHADIGDRGKVSEVLNAYEPEAVIHFAAESHVDRSIDGPMKFVETNVLGTASLLAATGDYFRSLGDAKQQAFRFLGVSTDEVYGSLGREGLFNESSPYDPSSPYSASKAASDHMIRAWHRTYGLPVLITNCSNNYGPYQFPEKLIPLMILNALEGKPLPIYGDGLQVRDWLHVEDHCDAISLVLERGKAGETYNIGASCEKTNLSVVQAICEAVDGQIAGSRRSAGLIRFVKDRPGHDRRYAIDATKIRDAIGWRPSRRFDEAINETVAWYLANQEWVRKVESGEYRRTRLGSI